MATSDELTEILNFRHFFKHATFGNSDYSSREKHLENYIQVSVAVDLVTVGTKTADQKPVLDK